MAAAAADSLGTLSYHTVDLDVVPPGGDRPLSGGWESTLDETVRRIAESL